MKPFPTIKFTLRLVQSILAQISIIEWRKRASLQDFPFSVSIGSFPQNTYTRLVLDINYFEEQGFKAMGTTGKKINADIGIVETCDSLLL